MICKCRLTASRCPRTAVVNCRTDFDSPPASSRINFHRTELPSAAKTLRPLIGGCEFMICECKVASRGISSLINRSSVNWNQSFLNQNRSFEYQNRFFTTSNQCQDKFKHNLSCINHLLINSSQSFAKSIQMMDAIKHLFSVKK